MYITKGIIVDTGAAYVQDPLYDDKLKVRIPELHGFGEIAKNFQEEPNSYTKDEDLPWCSIITTKTNYPSIYSILAHKAQSYSPADMVYVQVDTSSPDTVYLVRGTYVRYNDGTQTSLNIYNGLDVSHIIENNVEFPEGLLKTWGTTNGSSGSGGSGGSGTGTGITSELKILLTGNSYTYYNGMGQILNKLCKATGKKLLVVRATKGGVGGSKLLGNASLEYVAWSNGKQVAKGHDKLSNIINKDFANYGRKGEWDYVFAQTGGDGSVKATGESDIDMFDFIMKNKALTSSQNFIIHDIPYAGSLNDAFYNEHMQVVNLKHCSIVSSRKMFHYYNTSHMSPSSNPWQEDLTIMDNASHPSARGMYIIALCYYAKLFGTSEFPTSTSDSNNYIELYNSDSGTAHEFITNRWHPTKKPQYAGVADSIKSAAAIKLQYFVRRFAQEAIGGNLYTFTTAIQTTEENKDTFWKAVSESNGSTVVYCNTKSNMVIFGDSRMVQMYNAKKNASFCAVWGGHYGYGAKSGMQIDSSDHLSKMKEYIKTIHSEQGTARIYLVSTINDYEGGNSGYNQPVSCIVKTAKELVKWADKSKLSVSIALCSLIGYKGGKSVDPYNKQLKKDIPSKCKYLNINSGNLEYQSDKTHFTSNDLSSIFNIMNKN